MDRLIYGANKLDYRRVFLNAKALLTSRDSNGTSEDEIRVRLHSLRCEVSGLELLRSIPWLLTVARTVPYQSLGYPTSIKLFNPFGCNTLIDQRDCAEINLPGSLPILNTPVSPYLTLSFWCCYP